MGTGPEGGFTLLEVVVSMAIFGIGVVLLIELFSGGLAAVRSIKDHTESVLLAREKLSEAMVEKDLLPVAKEGVTPEGMEWGVEVSPYGEADGAAYRIFKIKAWAGRATRPEYAIETLKAVRITGPAGD